MRREFIIVLLGILCTTMFSSILSNIFVVDTSKILLLDTVAGAVGAGNFSYWHLGHMGPLQVELTSISGDADLYVADNVRPSYEIDQNNFSSVTCGHDIVNIPADFPRPIGIGVFGHWSHDLSEYSIQVYLDMAATPLFHEGFYSQVSMPAPLNYVAYAEKRAKERDAREASRREEDSTPRFSKLLNILDIIFELFVF